MSLSAAFGSRRRTPSLGSHSSPQRIPGSSDSNMESSFASDNYGSTNYGSFRGRPEISALNPSAASAQREPTRSSVHLSYRGPQGTSTLRRSCTMILTLLQHLSTMPKLLEAYAKTPLSLLPTLSQTERPSEASPRLGTVQRKQT